MELYDFSNPIADNFVVDVDQGVISGKKNNIIQQGEHNARHLQVELVQNGVPVDLTNCDVYFLTRLLKSGNTPTMTVCEIFNEEKGHVKVAIKNYMTSTDGVIECEFVRIGHDKTVLPFKKFNLTVDGSIYTDDAIEASEPLHALVEALATVREVEQHLGAEFMDLEAKYAGELSKTNAQLSTKANEVEVVKKGYGTLSDFDEETRLILQGMESGSINAVLGDGNVFNHNLSEEVKNSFYSKKTLYNLVKSPLFNDESFWTPTCATGNVDNGIYTIIPTEQYAQVSSDLINVKTNDKLYIYAKTKVDDSWGVKLEIVNQLATSVLYQKELEVSSEFTIVSDILEITDASLPIKMRLIDYMPEPNANFYLSNPLIINLTETFGAGNEPTKEELETDILRNRKTLFFDYKTTVDDHDLIKGFGVRPMYVDYTPGNDLIVSFKYNEMSDMRITFGKCGVNQLFSFKNFDLYNHHESFVKPIKSSDKVNQFLEVNTDFISPYVFGGDIPGDSGDTYYFTGGWHGYNGDSTGTPTARNINVKVAIDNIFVNSKCSCYCDELKIIVTNRVQAFNTVKIDGSGAEMLEEKITFIVTPGNVNVDVQIKSLGNIMLMNYMGIQVQNHAW
ncbi:MAG: BppU family phage baseplate upper protein, partial [Turicibacter sp.]|nr:BppU family phage baseplate upper protein [Turicibacter sp.]